MPFNLSLSLKMIHFGGSLRRPIITHIGASSEAGVTWDLLKLGINTSCSQVKLTLFCGSKVSVLTGICDDLANFGLAHLSFMRKFDSDTSASSSRTIFFFVHDAESSTTLIVLLFTNHCRFQYPFAPYPSLPPPTMPSLSSRPFFYYQPLAS